MQLNIIKIINCLCGEYHDIHYDKIVKLSQNNYRIKNTMSIKNDEILDDYDIIDIKDL